MDIKYMAATREEVNEWIESAKKNNMKYIISVCDTFDYYDYPVYCEGLIDLKEDFVNYDGVNMQQINEIIRINVDGSVDENLNISNIIT